MARVTMTQDWQGFKKGQTYDLLNNVADAYVHHARTAVYASDEPKSESQAELKTRDIPGPRDERRNRK